MQQRWSATKNEAFTIYQSDLKFDLYLRGAHCILYCNHKPIEPLLLCGMKIPKLNCWSMELLDYTVTFVHTKDSNNILADAISRLRPLDIYKDPVENSKTAIHYTEECTAEVVTNNINTLSSYRLCAEQKKDINFRNLAAQSHCKNRNSFNSVMISDDGLLQKQQYVHGLKHDVIIAPHSIIPIILHEFHNSKGHQGTIHTLLVA